MVKGRVGSWPGPRDLGILAKQGRLFLSGAPGELSVLVTRAPRQLQLTCVQSGFPVTTPSTSVAVTALRRNRQRLPGALAELHAAFDGILKLVTQRTLARIRRTASCPLHTEP